LPKNLKGNGLKRDSIESAKIDDNHYVDGKVCEEAIEALKRYSKMPSPFFLAVGFRKPHLPFNAPTKYWDLYQRKEIPAPESTDYPTNAPEIATRSWKELEGYTDIPSDGMIGQEKTQELRHGYYACVSYIDALVGRLIKTMSELDLSEETVICIWGDHGYHLGEQGLWTKANNYELSVRVPLIVSIPKQRNQGSKSNGLVELVDLYPSICEACQIKIPSGLEGTSFIPLLNDPDKQWKKAAYSQFPRNRTRNRHSTHGDIMGYSVRTTTHRYTEWREWKTNKVIDVELYDHRNDPREMRNIAPIKESQSQLKALSKVIKEGWKSLQ
jgi:arylsulfatase A-like enzyme